jgi:hypothetical protein
MTQTDSEQTPAQIAAAGTYIRFNTMHQTMRSEVPGTVSLRAISLPYFMDAAHCMTSIECMRDPTFGGRGIAR